MLRFVLATALLAAGCGHLKTPRYRPNGGYLVTANRTPSSELISRRPAYAPQAGFRLYWPVERLKLNRGFRPASDRRHQGIDLGGRRGTPILAAHEGIVIYTGRGFRGYGNMVLIEYDHEWATLYAHLDEIIAREGQIVRAGDPIGAMGSTGEATGVHLHFELIHQQQPVDPFQFINQRIGTR